MANINVPCNGNAKTHNIPKVRDKITFGTSGNCTFTSFNFVGNPSCFTNRQPPNGGGPKISYDYDSSSIPDPGYEFQYATTGTGVMGNGTGVIKN
jgi:hypothetical protein